MKYKIGQMVELSAAGRKRRHNPHRVFTGFGIVMNHFSHKRFPYEIMWFTKGEGKTFSAKEYEIKRVKAPKSNKK
jgi:ribosomal protein L21E